MIAPILRMVPPFAPPIAAPPCPPRPQVPVPSAAPPVSAAFSPEVVAALEVLKRAFGAVSVAPAHTVASIWETYARSESAKVKSWQRSAACGRLILGAFGDREASSLTLLDIEAWRASERLRITHRHTPTQPATRNRTLVVFRRMLNWAVEFNVLAFNPLARLKLERENNLRETVLTDADVDKIMAAADPLTAAIVLVLYDTGCRRSEILNLRLEQVDVENRCIRLSSKQTKNGHARCPRLTQRALAAILAMPRYPDSPFVFCSPVTGRPRNPRLSYTRFQQAVARSGVKGANGETITMHSLRHSFIAKARKLRLPERTVMGQTGHLTRCAYDRYGGQADAEELAALIGAMEQGKAVQP